MSRGRVDRWLSWPLGALAIVVVLPLAMLFVAAWVSGWRVQTVETGSMEPTVPAGSAIIVEPIDASDVRVGMPIAFRDESRDGRMVTHRVIEVLDRPAGVAFRTQGDANDNPDAPLVSGRAVEGRMRWHVPYLGQAVGWLDWPWSFAALVAAPLAVLLVSEIVTWQRRGVARSESPILATDARVTASTAPALPDIATPREGTFFLLGHSPVRWGRGSTSAPVPGATLSSTWRRSWPNEVHTGGACRDPRSVP